MSYRSLSSPLAVALIAAAMLCAPANSQSQLIPGKNVNMLSIPKATSPFSPPFNKDGSLDYVDYDIFHQRQNEPSVCVFTNNPLTLLAGSNDYRTVDIPAPSGVNEETKDAWLSYYVSTDGGLTWPKSTLVPGFPQDTSATGMSAPMHGFNAASDPTVRCGVGGMAYYSGIAFNRGGSGIIFLARFVNDNNTETSTPVRYLGASTLSTGTKGQFNDKPWVATDVPRPTGSGTCTVPAGPGNNPPQRTFTGGRTYVSFTTFLGQSTNNPHSRINVASSLNCGATWNTPVQVSTNNSQNLGTQLAVDPTNGNVYVAWRQIAPAVAGTAPPYPNAIYFAKSTNGGASFSAPTVVANINPFDQTTSSASFRTLTFPTMAVDGNGHIYIGWSQTIGPGGDARIVWTTSIDGGNHWSAPLPVDNAFQSESTWSAYNSFNTAGRGHQIMPSLTFAAGKLMLVWYDFRDDNTQGVFTPVVTNNTLTGQFTETRMPLGDPIAKVFTSTVADVGLATRHLVDVRASQNLFDGNGFCAVPNASSPGCQNVSTRVSQYVIGSNSLDPKQAVTQRGFNPPNFPMFIGGTAPFLGDYIEVAARLFYLDPTVNASTDPNKGWRFNTAPSVATIFHAVWADNRDVRPTINGDWTQYTPPGSTGGTSTYDPTQPRPACPIMPASTTWVPTDSRNQNIYSARLLEGLAIGAAANFKPKNSSGLSTFAVFAQNATNQPRSFRFSIPAQPTGATASFQQTTSLLFVDVNIPAQSTRSETLFETLTTATQLPPVTVHICEIAGVTFPPAGGCDTSNLFGDVILNDDPGNTGSGITSSEIYTPEMGSPINANTATGNPEIGAPEIGAPEIGAPEIGAPEIGAMAAGAPEIGAPEIGAPEIGAPEIGAPEIGASTLGDASSTFSNNGTTSGSYSVRLLNKESYNCCVPPHTPGDGTGCSACQLVIHKVYTTGAHQSCDLTQVSTQNVLVNSVPGFVPSNPGTDLTNPGITDPNIPTVTLKPGESTKVTLRVVTPGTTNVNNTFLNPETGVTSAPGTVIRSIGGSQAVQKGASAISLSLGFTTVFPSPATYGIAYTFDLTPTVLGGTAPNGLAFTKPASPINPFPTFLTLTGGKLLSATAPTPAGNFPFDVVVTDSSVPPQTDPETMTLVVQKAPTSFKSLSVSQTIVYGTPSIMLSGQLTTPSTLKTFVGEQVSIKINGVPQTATIADALGNFSVSFPTGALTVPLSPYTVTYSYAGDGNFLSVSDASTTLTVIKATAKFSPVTASQSIVYGTPTTTLSGNIIATNSPAVPPAPETVSITINGVPQTAAIVAGGSFSVSFPTSTLAVSGSPYTVTYSYAGDGNFLSASDASTTLTVIKATAKFSPVTASQSIVYGTPTTTLSGNIIATNSPAVPPAPETVSITINGAPPQTPTIGVGGSFSVSFPTGTLAVSGSPYTITYSYTGDSNFLSASDASTALTVTPAPLTGTVQNANRTYGASINPPFSVSYTGFVYGQGTSLITGTLACSTTATLSTATTPGSSVGNYPITCSGQSAPNYTITYAVGTLTVNPKPLTLTAANAQRTYGTPDPPYSVVPFGLANGDTLLTALTTGATCMSTDIPVLTSPVGNYSINCSGAVAPNYIITNMPGTLIVQPILLTFSVQPTNTAAGQIITPAVQVTATDSVLRVPYSAGAPVTISIGANLGGGTLSGGVPQTVTTDSNGLANFANLSIDQPGVGYTLSAAATGATTAASNPFNIDSIALIFSGSSLYVTAGQAITPAVTVTAQDAVTLAPLSGFSINLSIGTNPSLGTLTGTLPQTTNASGVATFSDLSIDKIGNGYTLSASAVDAPNTASAPLNVVTVSGTGPDLAAADASFSGTNLVLSVRYVPGTFDPTTTLAQFQLDTDLNTTTGSAYLDNTTASLDNTIGVDYLVSMSQSACFTGSPRNAQLQISQFMGPQATGSFSDTSTIATINVATDSSNNPIGYDVTVPLAQLNIAVPPAPTPINFKVTTALYNGCVQQPNSDVMPSLGSPPATIH